MARIIKKKRVFKRKRQDGGGSPVQRKRCKCKMKLDSEEPILLVKQFANNEITFKPHYDEDEPCADKEDCRTEKSWKWTVEKIDGDATLVVDNKEVGTVRAKAGVQFKLCVTVTVKCWTRVEAMEPSDSGTASMEVVGGRCQDSGCAEFRASTP